MHISSSRRPIPYFNHCIGKNLTQRLNSCVSTSKWFCPFLPTLYLRHHYPSSVMSHSVFGQFLRPIRWFTGPPLSHSQEELIRAQTIDAECLKFNVLRDTPGSLSSKNRYGILVLHSKIYVTIQRVIPHALFTLFLYLALYPISTGIRDSVACTSRYAPTSTTVTWVTVSAVSFILSTHAPIHAVHPAFISKN